MQLYPHFLLHIGIAVIQIRLPTFELVEVPLATSFVECPGRAAEHAQPIIRRFSVILFPVRPYIIIRVFADTVYTLIEPIMLIGGVIGHEIENNLKVARESDC